MRQACPLSRLQPRQPPLSLHLAAPRSSEGKGSVSIQKGGRQIEYKDQDPRIHRKWLEAIEQNGVASKMGDIFDEPKIMALPQSALTGVIRQPRSIGPAI